MPYFGRKTRWPLWDSAEKEGSPHDMLMGLRKEETKEADLDGLRLHGGVAGFGSRLLKAGVAHLALELWGGSYDPFGSYPVIGAKHFMRMLGRARPPCQAQLGSTAGVRARHCLWAMSQ